MDEAFVDITVAARLLGKTQRRIRQMCVAGGLRGACKLKGRWKIPKSCDHKLAGIKKPDELTGADELLDVPENKRQEAYRRLGLLKKFEKFAAAFVRDGGGRSDAVKIFASQNSISARSVLRWLRRYRRQGLLGLVDTRGGGRFLSEMISPGAFELFKGMYLTQQQLSVKTCLSVVNLTNRKEEHSWKVPSLGFMYRYIERQIPLFVKVLHREGMAAYEAKCAPYIEVDPDSVDPGQIWVGDHHQFNCWVRHRGKWVRPWITAWMDMRSRVIVGWQISASPNQTTIMTAMKQGIDKYGPPDSVKIDNGRDYDSQMFTGTTKAKRKALKKGYIDETMIAGIYAMMDISVSFAIPYHPQSKSIERWFGTLDVQFTKTMRTYCGKDADRKPDHLNSLLDSQIAIKEAYDMAGFSEVTGEYIKVYNASAHTGRGMEGRGPLEVMAERSSRRVIADGVTDLLLRTWSGELTVGKNGVNFKRMWYGQFDYDLMKIQGQKVRVAYDPADLAKVYVYDAVTLRLVTIAEQNQLISYGSPVSEEALRDATKAKARAVKIAKQFRSTQQTANTDLTTLAIQAMAEGLKDAVIKPAVQNIRPVKTPMDGQVRAHQNRLLTKMVKKAAGAESVEEVLDIDLSLLSPDDNKYEGVKLFDE